MSPHRPARGGLILLIVVLLVAGVVWFVRGRPTTTAPKSADQPAPAASVASPPPPVPAADPDRADLAAPLLQHEWDALIAEGEAAAKRGPAANQAFVYQLFAALDRLLPDDRLAVLLAFFESGRDVRLGDSFAIGPGGYLRDWPTLRVAMFDYLSQRDGTAARVLAEKWLQTRPTEAGEWTLALRELVRGRTVETWPPIVVTRVHDFLTDPTWAATGSRAWLEGFDLAVAGKAPVFLPDLSAIATQTTARSAQFAAFLAADRMMLAAPDEMLVALNGDRGLFAAQPHVRAGLFARADVRLAGQLRELETYFSRTDLSPEERTSFGDLFPLYDLAVSQNLLTPSPHRTLGDMVAHDRSAVKTIERWLGEARFAHWHPTWRGVHARLISQLSQIPP